MSKIGEIYEVSKLSPKRYFQLVSYDETQLTSDVIGVFNYKGELRDNSQEALKELLDSGVEFYTHTTVNQGIKEDIWRKVGSLPPIDFSNALFKGVDYGDDLPDIEPYEANSYHSWVVWRPNQEWEAIGSDISKYPTAELGMVFPAKDVVYRIEHGRYEGVPYYGQVR